MKKYDYAVIGGGSAGVRSARVAASLGKKTVIFESKQLGGTCVNVGCVPKKIYAYAAEYRELIEDAKSYGWTIPTAGTSFDPTVLTANKDRQIERLNGIYEKTLTNAGAEIVWEHAVFTGDRTLTAAGETYEADKILIATGGKPFRPEVPGIDQTLVSDDIFSIKKIPGHITVVGGGYIALEMACIFNGWGAAVDIVYRGGQVLKKFDHDIGRFLQAEMEKKGIRFRLHTDITSISGSRGKLNVQTNTGENIATEEVLYATGRRPNTESLNMALAGVQTLPNGKIQVDERFTTTNPNIYAAGDVCHSIELTPTAILQGAAIANNLFAGTDIRFDPTNVASAVFTSPQASSVGLSEAAARAQEPVDVFYADIRPLKYAITENPSRSMMKLVVSQKTSKVLGVHMVGVYAAEIIQGFAVAVKMGATKADFDATVAVHPTSAEEFVTLSTPRGN